MRIIYSVLTFHIYFSHIYLPNLTSFNLIQLARLSNNIQQVVKLTTSLV